MILQFMQEVDVIDEFSLIVKGFTDTLPVMKKHLKDRTKAKKRFKLEILAQDFLEPENIGRLHNGLTDVRILFDLIHHPLINIPDDKLFETGVTVNYLLNRKIIRDASKMKEAPLKKVILAEKDENGKLSKTEGVSAGIKLLLGQNVGSQARVTTTGRIIDAIVMRLQKICIIK
ncbi:uncharacterized protein [Chelonus insularis]|uniref:uncharacterized protein n=1 Tax=Chelonus insularis TaxID=460826 RepID=UPI00158D8165|nr:uncharacterized protein LOC118065346 [Chelonus insularis]